MLPTANYHVPYERSGSKTVRAERMLRVQCAGGNTQDITRTRITLLLYLLYFMST